MFQNSGGQKSEIKDSSLWNSKGKSVSCLSSTSGGYEQLVAFLGLQTITPVWLCLHVVSSSVCALCLISLSSYKDTVIRLGSTLIHYALFLTWYICNTLISKQSHVLTFCMNMNLGGHYSNQYTTQREMYNKVYHSPVCQGEQFKTTEYLLIY